ncbi:MlaD family protein, partial [Mycobacterium palustre]|uniref:MlaD family protein n=1 Tax=Mycobacterium palustre TaxID=153971 RepID=UPI0021F3A672
MQINSARTPPYRLITYAVLLIVVVLVVLVYIQFRGGFTPKMKLTMVASRAGLVMDPGSKVTYNGVEIGRVAHIAET